MDQKSPSEVDKQQNSSQGVPGFGSTTPPTTGTPAAESTTTSVAPSSASPAATTPLPSFGSIGNTTPSESVSSASPTASAGNVSPTATPPASGSPTSPSLDHAPKHGPNVILLAGIVILVIAVLGGAFFLAMMQSTPTPAPVEVPPTVTAAPSPTSTEPSPTSAVSSTTGNSNEQLQKDTQTIEASITGVANDESAIDEGLNDQQAELTQ
ncbi:MAG: hypothetical protein AAB553_03905 [Patescibacteria group bacterium]